MGMSDDIEPDEDGDTLVCLDVPFFSGKDKGPRGFVTVALTAYLCPNCDSVHFDLMAQREGGTPLAFALRLDPKEAEKLGYKLINPPAALPEHLS